MAGQTTKCVNDDNRISHAAAFIKWNRATGGVRDGERRIAMYESIYESIQVDREREHARINMHAWKSQQPQRRSMRIVIADLCRSLAQRLAPILETDERASEGAAQA
jgi:hypothetical protein